MTLTSIYSASYVVTLLECGCHVCCAGHASIPRSLFFSLSTLYSSALQFTHSHYRHVPTLICLHAGGDGGDREGPSRRASMRAANNQATYNYGLQLDIERMFSKKVNVFDTETFTLSLECVLAVVMKAAVKASMEEIRVHAVGPLALSQLTIDFTFLKQVMGCVLKDAADVECLVEEVLATLASRSIEDGAGRDLTTVLPKAVNDGLYMAGKKCVLLR